ncbi:TIGR04388 family protein [Leptospira ilyithenensis]|uniref:TIGR04388 family protein n=1 Tax=Leptospira ilyithenensis TaxID=2484901 RepID=UPI002482D835|nr:TIGR04388 family protein [Leptospira ilyithenensis]
MHTWESRANLDFLRNRDEFVLKLNTNRVDTTYLNRIGVQTTLSQDTANQALQLQQQITNATNQWSQNFNQNYAQGLNDFAGSLEIIQSKYKTFLTAMDKSDTTFQTNLYEIDQYKTAVKSVIQGMVTQFGTSLATACDKPEDCTYRYANGGGLNDAGKLLEKLVDKMNGVLSNTALDPSNILTTISTEITNFLSTTSVDAKAQSTNYYNKINTYQISTTLSGGISAATATQAQIDELANRVRNSTYGYWATLSESEQNWAGVSGGQDMFNNIGSDSLEEMLKAIRDGNEPKINALLATKLGTTRYGVTDVLLTNIFTYGGQKNMCCNGIGINYAQKEDRNWLAEPDDYHYWEGVRYWEVARFHMGYVTYGALFKVYDAQSDAMYSYWNSNSTSLSNQLNKYTNDINPAISNWEGQVASYNSFYEQWKTNADALKEQAKTDYENSLADLEVKKTAWLSKIEIERQDGVVKWEELQRNAQSIESKSDLAAIKADFRAVKSTGIDFSTGTDLVLTGYGGNLVSLTSTEFEFKDPAIAGNTIGPKDILNVVKEGWNEIKSGSIYEKVSALGSFALGGVAGGLGFVQTDPILYKSLTGNSSTEPVISLSTSQNKITTSSPQKYNIFTAAYDKEEVTSLTIGKKDIGDIFGDTVNGVGQYATLLSMNENNTRLAEKEQEKVLNQLTYSIKWNERAVLKYNENGELTGAMEYQHILNQMNESKYAPMVSCMANKGALYNDCFKEIFKESIAYLYKDGLEYQEGMIVRSLNRTDKIVLGQTTGMLDLTAEEKKAAGTCYVNPTQCWDLLRQDYTYTINKETSVATLTSKPISNGRVAGNINGRYVTGTQTEVRYVNLSQVAPVIAPKGKDLFDVWEDEDIEKVIDQRMAVLTDFYDNRLSGDVKRISTSVNEVAEVKARNERKFEEEKKAQEGVDSFLKEMVLAYISGGTAGFNSAIKGKVEGAINSSIAGALIRATGGSEESIQLVSDAIGFMRGRMQANKIKARANFVSYKDPWQGLGNIFKQGFDGMMNNPVLTAGLAYRTKGVSTAFFRGAAYMGAVAFGYKSLDKAGYESMKNQIVGSRAVYREIKTNEESMIKRNATSAIAAATGLPADLVTQLLTDFKGQRDAKKARSQMNSNPYATASAMINGLAGGIYKTATVAMGIPERDISAFFDDIHSMAYAGNLDITKQERVSQNYIYLSAGIKTPGSSYTSNIPGDTAGIVEEIGKKIVVEELVKATGMDKDIVDAWFRKGYGNIQQKKEDRKAQNAAVRSTLITAALLIPTMGQYGSLGTGAKAFLTNIGRAVGVADKFAPAVGAAMVRGTIQVVDGTRNGWKGAAAGFVNGTLGVITQGAFQGSTVTQNLFQGAQNAGLGLGMSYDEENGWGAMVGLGNQAQNFDFRFSEYGDDIFTTSFKAGNGLQITNSYNTSSGAAGVGINVNSGKGPRQGFNLNINYDTKDRFTGGVSYTNQPSGIGISGNWDRDGQAYVSSLLNGITLGTNGADGYTAEEIDWMQDNINRAQDAKDRRDDDLKLIKSGLTQNYIDGLDEVTRGFLVARADENELLRTEGKLSDDAIVKLTEEQREDLLKSLVKEPVSVESIALMSLGIVGTSAMAAFAFMGLGGGASNGAIPPVRGQVVEVARRREDEDGSVGTEDGITLHDLPQSEAGNVGGIVTNSFAHWQSALQNRFTEGGTISSIISDINKLSESDKRQLVSDSIQSTSNRTGFERVEGVDPVILIKETPTKVFKDETSLTAAKLLEARITQGVDDFNKNNPISKTILQPTPAESKLLKAAERANQTLNEKITSPEFSNMNTSVIDLRSQIQDARDQIKSLEINTDTSSKDAMTRLNEIITEKSNLIKQTEISMQRLIQKEALAASKANAAVRDFASNGTEAMIQKQNALISKTQTEYEAKLKQGESIASEIANLRLLRENPLHLETLPSADIKQTLLNLTGSETIAPTTADIDKRLNTLGKSQKDLEAKTSTVKDRLDIANRMLSTYELHATKYELDKIKYNQDVRDQKLALELAHEIASTESLKDSLSSDFKEKLAALESAELKLANLDQKYGDSLDDQALRNKIKEYQKLSKEIEKAKEALQPHLDDLRGVVHNLDHKIGIEGSTESLASITTLTKPEVIKETIEVPIYENADGEFRIGGGPDPGSLVSMAAPGGILYQGDSPEAKNLAAKIKTITGVDVNPDTIQDKWCQAASLWSTLRHEFGDAVEADFADFIKKQYQAGNILISEPGNVMQVEHNDTIMDSYANVFEKAWDRTEISPSTTRDEAYSELASFMSTTNSNSVMLRVSDTHTITLHRQGTSWIVEDTADPTINGSTFDPNEYKKSSLYLDAPYGNEIPESYAYAKDKK